MKRFIIRLLLGSITLTFGVAAHRLLSSQLVADALKPPNIRSATANLPEAATQSDVNSYMSELILDYDSASFDPTSAYIIVGRKPQAFCEFDGIEITVRDDDGIIIGEISILITTGSSYYHNYQVSGIIKNRHLTFIAATASKDDPEYRFEGIFLRGGGIFEADENTPVLKGKLSKYSHGVKIAEAVVKFHIEYDAC